MSDQFLPGCIECTSGHNIVVTIVVRNITRIKPCQLEINGTYIFTNDGTSEWVKESYATVRQKIAAATSFAG